MLPTAQPPASRPTSDAEQRLAIPFTDVEGSTQPRDTRAYASADEILRIQEGIVRRHIADRGRREMLFISAPATVGCSG